MRVEELSLLEWGDKLPAEGFDVFHLPAVLEVLDEHTADELYLLGGYRGQQLVGLLPVFVRRKSVAKAVLSPPPGVSIPRMGPVVLQSSPKRRKREQINRDFTSSMLTAIDADSPLTIIGLVCSPEYTDPRPYSWAGYDVVTNFTYRLNLEEINEADLLASFTRDLRSEIRKGENLELSIEVASPDAVGRVYEEYQARYAEQGIGFPTSREFTVDLVTTLEDRARVYIATTPSGEFLGGISVLYSNTIGYYWMGGVRENYRGVSVNSLLLWRIIGDILTDPSLEHVSKFDLGSANSERLTEFKSKFDPELIPYYEVHSGAAMTLAKKLYYQLTY